MKELKWLVLLIGIVGLPVSLCRAQPGTAVWAITDADCIWKLDGKVMGEIRPKDQKIVDVMAGKHLVEAVTAHGAVIFHTIVDVPAAVNQPVQIHAKANPNWIDHSTNLMWTSEDNGYPVTWQESVDYCRNLTQGGYSGWRLPEIGELERLYDPTVHTLERHVIWSPPAPRFWEIRGNLNLSSWTWSNTPGNVSGEAWSLDFQDGSRYSGLKNGNYDRRALCVLGRKVAGQQVTAVEDGHATWTDERTGLMWTTDDTGSDTTLDQAVYYCRDMTTAGYSGWRLPEIGELQQIYDPSADISGWHVRGNFKLTGWTWSHTAGIPGDHGAWAFGFSGGYRHSFAGVSPGMRVLCVRRSGK